MNDTLNLASVQPPTCPRGYFVGYAGSQAILGPAWCKAWRCATCGPRKARRLAARIANAPVNKLLTLTVRPLPEESPAECLDRLNARFRDLIKRIRRRFPYSPVKYVKVVEVHKSGFPHLHVALSSPYIPQRWLSRAWSVLTGSPVLDIRAIGRKKGAAKYLAKYLTKQTEAVSSRRRWSASPGFLPKLEVIQHGPAAVMDSWYYSGASLEALALMLVEDGWAFESGEHWVRYPYVLQEGDSSPG